MFLGGEKKNKMLKLKGPGNLNSSK